MAGLIRREFRTYSASNLVDDINGFDNGGVLTQEDALYLAIGRSAAWTDENIPPTPTTKNSEATDFWTNIEGMVRITPQQAALVIPRKNWVSGTIYKPFDDTLLDSVAYAENFYVRNSNNNVYMVTESTLTPSTTEPTHTSGLLTTQGTTYKYLYTISSADQNRFMTDNWMPVNFETIADGGNLLPGEVVSHLDLGARDVMLFANVPEDGVVIDNTIKYRQIAVIRNPVLDDGAATVADGSQYGNVSGVGFITSPSGATNSVIRNTGEFMYLENKLAIQRRGDQVENVRLIVEY